MKYRIETSEGCKDDACLGEHQLPRSVGEALTLP